MKRRDFIKLSTLATASGIVTPYFFKSNAESKTIKIAMCGLGNYAEKWMAPAIEQSKYAKLTAIITGSPNKIEKWQNRYNIKSKNIFNYNNMDSIAENSDIDCVYVCTPTGNHAEYSIRSFEAGKHVICEKPMAPFVKDCDDMINAAKKAKKMLQIGYRLYWDPYNIHLIDLKKNKKYGNWINMSGGFSYRNRFQKDNWRLKKAMNVGGAVYDIGVYVVQSAFYTTHSHPLSLKAKSWTERKDIFKEFPEYWEWEMEWPNGNTSKHSSNYGIYENYIKLQTTKGEIGLNPAYSYRGLKGYTPSGPMDIKPVFQQKLQIDGQCLAILKKQPNITSGEMGRRDIRILNAIMESAKVNQKIYFKEFPI